MNAKKKNIAIIGANEFQNPLILAAKEMGYTTHVFAWQAGDIGEKTADYFYPVSIVELDKILDICRKLDLAGIVSIGSDLASITVNYVAEKLGLTGNGMGSALTATNKHLMRLAFEKAGLPSCRSRLVSSPEEAEALGLPYPVIVKPTDRSGSRGIFKVTEDGQLRHAVEQAMSHSFEKKALVEEFAQGREYSIEYISWQGQHHFLAQLRKHAGKPRVLADGQIPLRRRVNVFAQHTQGAFCQGPGLLYCSRAHGPDNILRQLLVGPDAKQGHGVADLPGSDGSHGSSSLSNANNIGIIPPKSSEVKEKRRSW